MTQLAEPFAWCMVQVTLFSFIAICLYAVATRRRLGAGHLLLLLSFAAIGALTMLCISSWPRWDTSYFGAIASRTSMKDTGQQFSGENGGLTSIVVPKVKLNESELPNATGADFAIKNSSPHHSAEGMALHKTSWRRWRICFVLAAWSAAVIGMLRLVMGLAHVWRCVHSSTVIDEPSMRELFMQVQRKLRLRRAVQLRESRALSVAVTFGWWKPIVLMPTAWREWSADQRRVVLAHELAHVKQRHFLAWLCSQLAVVAHYYHPLVHWLARQLRFEQELAADRLAARVFGGERCYARVLAEIALATRPPRQPITAVGLFMSRPLLMRRLAMLRSTKRSDRRSKLKRCLALAFVALGAVAVAGVRAGQQDDRKPGSASNGAPQIATSQSNEPSEPVRSTAPSLTVAPYVLGEQLAGQATAVALFQVSRQPRRISGESRELESDQSWQILCKTQLALLKSYFVLQSALRDPEIASLPLIRAQKTPMEWLANRLIVGFKPGSEIMYVQMHGETKDAEQLRQIVDAVVKKYEEEIVYTNQQQRLGTRDLLAQAVKKLRDELTSKMEDFYELARGNGTHEIGTGQIAQQLDIKRLERIEEELMRLENEQLVLETSGGNGNPQFFEKRIQQLSKRREELETRIMSRTEASVDLSQRKQEIERLERIADDLSTQLELMDVESNAPPRIQLIQPAIVVGAGEDAVGANRRNEDRPR